MRTAVTRKKPGAKPKAKARAPATLDPMRRGLPAPDSVTGVKELQRGGKTYRIIKTTERDEYEEPPAERRRKPRR